VAILDRAPKVGVVYGDREFFGELTGRQTTPEFTLQRLLLGNFIDACAVFRRAIWEECGGYDTEMPDQLGYEDWEFWLRLAKRGWEFLRIAEVVLDYRVRLDSMSERCRVPETLSRLVRYIAAKHQDLYAAYLPEVLAAKELLAASEARERARAQEELAQIRAELEGAVQEARSELERMRRELADVQRAQHGAVEQLGHQARRSQDLQATIVDMRTSAFWKARDAYVRLRRLIHPGWS
jgi:hypothetical protein